LKVIYGDFSKPSQRTTSVSAALKAMLRHTVTMIVNRYGKAEARSMLELELKNIEMGPK
jgi:hypothetical protein